MTHAHHPGPDGGPELAPPRARRLVHAVLAVLAVATVAAMAWLWPGDVPELSVDVGFGVELVDATVVAIEPVPCRGLGDTSAIGCELVRAEVTSGPNQGSEARLELVVGGAAPPLQPGDRVVLSYNELAPPELAYQFADFQRGRALWLLAGLFAVAAVALGRWKGLRAIIGVGASLAILGVFLLPALLDGRSPVVVAVVAASAIAFIALYSAHGFNARTSVALLGTLASLGLTVGLATAFVGLTRLTGLADEEATLLAAAAGQVDPRGLLLAGIVIGALGVLDDVTITQVSATWEIKRADPSFGPAELYRRSVRVGRDHIASTVNTLVLAYAGAALPLLLLFTQAGRSLGDVITSEVVATEIVRTLVGSLGLIASVPVTTALAAIVIGPVTEIPDEPDGRSRRRERRARPRRNPFWDDVEL